MKGVGIEEVTQLNPVERKIETNLNQNTDASERQNVQKFNRNHAKPVPAGTSDTMKAEDLP